MISMNRMAFALVAALALPSVARAGTPHDFSIYAIRLGGDPAQAKPYVDRFARHLEGVTGWPASSASGGFYVSRKEALAAIEQQKPGWAVVEPSLYLELRKSHKAVAIAQVKSKDLNTPQLMVVVKDPAWKSLDDLAGKRIWTQLADAGKYLSHVVLDGKGTAETRFVLKQVGASHHMNVDYSAYEGWKVTGKTETVLLRGQVAIEDGEVKVTKGYGQFVKRK